MQPSAISADLLAKCWSSSSPTPPHAVAVENGEVLFDFSTAKYSVSGEGKCILHLWSEERNAVRRVLDAELKGRTLRLNVLRFGQAQPKLLEICADRDRRTGTLKRLLRTQYQRVLERVLLREFRGFKLEHLSSRPDLEHSFSPVYTRAVLRQDNPRLPCSASMQRKPSPPSTRRSPSAFSGWTISASSLPDARTSQG